MPGSTLRGVAAEAGDRVAHRGEVGDRGHAGEVLHQHARGHELQLAVAGLLRRPAAVGDGADVVGGYVDAVFAPQQILHQDAQRIRQHAGVADDRVEPEDVVRTVADGELRTCTKAVESHAGEATLRLCGRRHCGRRRRHQARGRRGARRRHARRHASTRRRRSTSTPTRCSRRSPASSTRSTRPRRGRGRRRVRRADGRGRRARLAAQHPRVAGVPAAGAPRRAHRASRCGSTTTPRRSRSAKAGSARRGARATTSAWSCRPASAAASCSTAACSTATTGNAGTSAT